MPVFDIALCLLYSALYLLSAILFDFMQNHFCINNGTKKGCPWHVQSHIATRHILQM